MADTIEDAVPIASKGPADDTENDDTVGPATLEAAEAELPIETELRDTSISEPQTLSSINDDFAHFERHHAKHPTEAAAVFKCMSVLRAALRAFKELADAE
jgi:hypothetical protein